MLRRLRFNFWYLRQPPWDSGISPPELLEFIQTHPAGRAIDLGCGTGTNVITLVKAGWQATGIDFAPRAIQLARQKLKQNNIKADISVGDATKLRGISGPFDLALDLGCYHGLTGMEREQYLDQLDRVLAPNGSWLLYAFLAPGTPRSGHGLDEADLNLISSRLTLLSRRNGFDKRERQSAWFLLQKNPDR